MSGKHALRVACFVALALAIPYAITSPPPKAAEPALLRASLAEPGPVVVGEHVAIIVELLTTTTFSLLGFIIGIWAEGFEKLQIVPLLIITPLTFLGGTFYSTSGLPPVWQTIALFNPGAYLISGFRWSFFEIADVGHNVSVGMTLLFLAACLATVWWMFRTGYKLKK